jgi:hypothetical protein
MTTRNATETAERAERLAVRGLLCAGLCDAVYFLAFTLS